MKKSWLIIIMLIFFGALATGCYGPDYDYERLISENGVKGEYQMKRMETYEMIQGSLKLHSCFFSASFNASISSEPAFQFYWSPKKDEIISTVLPYSKFRFIIDDTKSIPTIEFLFDIKKLVIDRRWAGQTDDVKMLCSKLLNHRLQNTNELIMSKYLETAIVRISNSSLENEIYLSK